MLSKLHLVLSNHKQEAGGIYLGIDDRPSVNLPIIATFLTTAHIGSARCNLFTPL